MISNQSNRPETSGSYSDSSLATLVQAFGLQESTCVEDTRASSSLQPIVFDTAKYLQVPPV